MSTFKPFFINNTYYYCDNMNTMYNDWDFNPGVVHINTDYCIEFFY